MEAARGYGDADLGAGGLSGAAVPWQWKAPEDISCLDVLEFLRGLPDGCLDAVVCDPPYGLSFMGAKWDSPDRKNKRRDMAEANRNLPDDHIARRLAVNYLPGPKPGARVHKTDGSTPSALGYSDGAERVDQPAYGAERNPNCLRCGKHIRGVNACGCTAPLSDETDRSIASFKLFSEWVTEWAAECMRCLRPGGYLLAMGGTRTYDALAWGIRMAGFEIRDCVASPGAALWVYAQGMPKSLDVSKALDRVAGAEREVVGPPRYTRGAAGQSYSPTRRVSYDYPPQPETAPATPEATCWEGHGTALKPAYEFVCCARKPFPRTLVANLREHGTGALDIDAGRIPASGKPPGWLKTGTCGTDAVHGFQGTSTFRITERTPEEVAHVGEAHERAGRWPPNFVVSHSEGCQRVGEGRAKTATGTAAGRMAGKPSDIYGEYRGSDRAGERIGYAEADGKEAVGVWECAPGCAVAVLDSLSGKRKSGARKPSYRRRTPMLGANGIYGDCEGNPDSAFGNTDVPAPEGGASRFFTLPDYDALPGEPQNDRDLDALDVGFYHPKVNPRDRKLPGYLIIVPESKRTIDKGIPAVNAELAAELCAKWDIPVDPSEGPLQTLTGWPIPEAEVPVDLRGRFRAAKSMHPTMKPAGLFRWLVRLYSPRPETVGRPVVVCDPFGGSGTAALAAAAEGRLCVINDFTPKYAATMDARFGDARPLAAGRLRPPPEREWGGEAVELAEPTEPEAAGESAPTKVCPKCGTVGNVESEFGYRRMKGKNGGVVVRPQSYCRSCRGAKQR